MDGTAFLSMITNFKVDHIVCQLGLYVSTKYGSHIMCYENNGKFNGIQNNEVIPNVRWYKTLDVKFDHI